MGTIERRLSKIEAEIKKIKSVINLKKNLSPREKAEVISEELFPPEFIGEKTKDVLIQAVTSFRQNFKPKTMTNKEKAELLNKLETLKDQIRDIWKTPDQTSVDLVLEIEKITDQLR